MELSDMHEHSSVLDYLLMALAGGLGGGGAVAFHYLRHRRMPWAMLVAYVVAGAVIGVVIGAWLLVLDANGVLIITEDWLMAVCSTSGMVAAVGLLILQGVAAVALRWRGIELAVTFREDAAKEGVPYDPLGSDQVNRRGK